MYPPSRRGGQNAFAAASDDKTVMRSLAKLLRTLVSLSFSFVVACGTLCWLSFQRMLNSKHNYLRFVVVTSRKPNWLPRRNTNWRVREKISMKRRFNTATGVASVCVCVCVKIVQNNPARSDGYHRWLQHRAGSTKSQRAVRRVHQSYWLYAHQHIHRWSTPSSRRYSP